MMPPATASQPTARASISRQATFSIAAKERLNVGRVAAPELVGVAQRQIECQRERYRVTQTLFEEELATFNDVFDSHVELLETKFQLYQVFYNDQTAAAEVRHITGFTDP